jgi:hypothetical protein
MTHRPIIDAGPSLNFFSINKERLLISVVGRLSAPETVEAEVLHKSRTDKRFSAAARTWAKLKPDWIEILSDSVTPELPPSSAGSPACRCRSGFGLAGISAS